MVPLSWAIVIIAHTGEGAYLATRAQAAHTMAFRSKLTLLQSPLNDEVAPFDQTSVHRVDFEGSSMECIRSTRLV